MKFIIKEKGLKQYQSEVGLSTVVSSAHILTTEPEIKEHRTKDADIISKI